MSKLYPDVPNHLRISDQVISGNAPYIELHKTKMPWTPRLLELVHSMRDDGDTWDAIAKELYNITGVLLSDSGISYYIERHGGREIKNESDFAI